jgi:hypothetical protein
VKVWRSQNLAGNSGSRAQEAGNRRGGQRVPSSVAAALSTRRRRCRPGGFLPRIVVRHPLLPAATVSYQAGDAVFRPLLFLQGEGFTLASISSDKERSSRTTSPAGSDAILGPHAQSAAARKRREQDRGEYAAGGYAFAAEAALTPLLALGSASVPPQSAPLGGAAASIQIFTVRH